MEARGGKGEDVFWGEDGEGGEEGEEGGQEEEVEGRVDLRRSRNPGNGRGDGGGGGTLGAVVGY